MAGSKDSLKDRLARYRQIKISVIGRKSGKTISIPVWFVLGRREAIPPARSGFDTQWYRTYSRTRRYGLMHEVRRRSSSAPLTDAKAVKSVVEKFREKYGAEDVKKYYSEFDVAVVVELV